MDNIDFENRILKYNDIDVDRYLKDLSLLGSLSRLFSDNDIPFVHYRVTENIYCDNMKAVNLARADLSIDAKLSKTGIGIKTFINTKEVSLQKIAEFNKLQHSYKNLDPIEKIKSICKLRNTRLEFTKRVYDVDNLIFHCVVRRPNKISLYEEDMNMININKIHLDNIKAHILTFNDDFDEYKFNEAKSTLYKKFYTKSYFAEVNVEIFDNPLLLLRKLKLNEVKIYKPKTIIVPLYSVKYGEKIVFPKSGLNTWNASGRKRNFNEAYIPFNKDLRIIYENFFPRRDEYFDVELPNGKNLKMSICQENGKAIMSNPNKDLGEWLLRDVMHLQEGEILTYDKLLEIGVDAVAFQKIKPLKYKLDFRKIGSFDRYIEEHNL